MNATPDNIDLNKIQSCLSNIKGITSTHYLHAWPLSSSGIAFSCHLVVPDQLLSQTEKLSEYIRYLLFNEFGIDHPVLQFETESCGNGSMLCEMLADENQKPHN